MRNPDPRAFRKWSAIARRASLGGLERLLMRSVRQAAGARSESARAYKLTTAEVIRRELDRRVLGGRG